MISETSPSAVALLDALTGKGAGLFTDGSRLRVTAPPGSVPPELQDAIRAQKGELILLVQSGIGIGATSAEEASEIQARLNRLSDEEESYFQECLEKRRAAGEGRAGIGWRALVDVRIRFGHWDAEKWSEVTRVAYP